MAYFEIQAITQGYHQYKVIWDTKFGEKLECQRETGNPHYIFAVAVLKLPTWQLLEVDGIDCAKGP